MLPRLVDRMGARRAVIVGAVIWAFWHTPFALSGVHHLDGVPAALTAVIMPIGHLGAGMVIGWLWLRTESIWMVVLAHGALNNWGQYAFKFMQGSGSTTRCFSVPGTWHSSPWEAFCSGVASRPPRGVQPVPGHPVGGRPSVCSRRRQARRLSRRG